MVSENIEMCIYKINEKQYFSLSSWSYMEK